MKTDNILIDEAYLIFKKLFRFKRKLEDEQIITEIYKCCLLFAVENLGWVYDLYTVDKSIFDIENDEHRKFMIMFLKQNLINSFIDYKKHLLIHMLKILQGVNDKIGVEILSATDNEFEYVFEKLVQNVFGTENVKDFYPRASYHFSNGKIKEASKLRPDSIMWLKKSTEIEILNDCNANFIPTELKNFIKRNKNEKFDDFVIIDAKFYGYGYSQKDETCSHLLPQSSDVTKQLAYANFIMHNKILNSTFLKNLQLENALTSKNMIISSVFLLPCSNDKFDVDQNEFEKNSNIFESVGFAVVGDADAERNVVFESNNNVNVVLDKKVFVCLIDLKTLINACSKNDKIEKQSLKKQLLSCLRK